MEINIGIFEDLIIKDEARQIHVFRPQEVRLIQYALNSYAQKKTPKCYVHETILINEE